MDTIGLWQVVENRPARLHLAGLAAERDLEGWIESDPALLERGLVIVGRQVRLEGGPLNLLALDPQGRWVLIEIKRERLRREVIAQAIDYASCLHRLEPARLREQCDAYLRSRSGEATLDALLEQRGRSPEAEADGREIIIYLVGTGYDQGLERMVGYLAERAELAVRMVTLSAFRDEQGGLLLAREIHESVDAPATAGRRPSTPAPSAEAVLALADQNGVGEVVRTLYGAAMELGLHARPWAKSIMFAPPANRTRCLFVVWVERRPKEPGVAKAYIAAEAFEQFYRIAEADLVAAVGPVTYVMLDQAGAERVSAGLRRLLAPKDSE
jgi:hypothetical protein